MPALPNLPTRAADAQADASQQRAMTESANLRAADALVDAGEQHQAANLARHQAVAAGAVNAAAEANSQQLQERLDELNAKVTDRGAVVTLGDLLFANRLD